MALMTLKAFNKECIMTNFFGQKFARTSVRSKSNLQGGKL